MANIEEEPRSDSEYESEIDENLQTSVFLGFVDVPISTDEQPEIEDSFIGGKPIWLHPESPPPSDLLKCKNCTKPMHLLLQSYANLENTLYDRVIYIFSCNNSSCRRKTGSVRAIRSICKEPEVMKRRQQELDDYLADEEKKKMEIEEHKEKLKSLGDDLFSTKKKSTAEAAGAGSSNPFGGSTSSNPFGTSASSNPFGTSASSNPFASNTNASNPFAKKEEPLKETPSKPTYAQVANPPKSSKPTTPSKALDIKLPQYPGFILYIDQEVLDPKKQQLPPLPEIQTSTSSSSDDPTATASSSKSSSRSSKQTPENEELTKMLDDSTFQNFTNTISYNPSQVLRYDLNGKPLLYSSTDKTSKTVTGELIPNPGFNPSSTRRFELQLMPKSIIDLESSGEIDILKEGMEWGTVLVYTDVEDYVPALDENFVGYVEEWCGVQWEEEVRR